MPPSDLKLSVFRVHDLQNKQIWQIGETFVAKPQQKTLYGRADIVVAVVLGEKLFVEVDNNPPGHVNIIGWPQEKHEQKSLAQVLASQATLHLRNSN